MCEGRCAIWIVSIAVKHTYSYTGNVIEIEMSPKVNGERKVKIIKLKK